MSLKPATLFILLLLLMAVNFTAKAMTLAELQQAGKVTIKTWIEPEENIIARQQINLQIEIATDKWFSAGTQIGRFDVKDAIVLQREKFALNSSRTGGDKNWTVQQWTLVVYPQRGGVFEIPAIPVQLSIAGDNLESIVGEIHTQPLSFVAKIPEPLLDKSDWVATNRFEIEDDFNKAVDALKPGDALIRTIRMSADNLPAMMLPKVSIDNLQDVATYPKPAQVLDKINRGDYLAERIETITYVFEKPGEYQLPAQTYYWWNLETGSLETIELSATTLSITRSSAGVDIAESNQALVKKMKSIDVMPLLIKLAVALIVLLIVWFIARRFLNYLSAKKSAKPVELSEKALQRKFDKACRDKDQEKAIALFYQWLDQYGGESFQGSIRKRLAELGQTQTMNEFNTIMRSIYTLDKNNNIDLRRFPHQFIKELKQSGQFKGVCCWGVDLRLN